MTNEELKQAIDEVNKKVDAIYSSVERTRKYFLWTLIISVVLFVLPLLGLVFLIPTFISSVTSGGF